MSELILSRLLAQQLRQIVDKREWSGTITNWPGCSASPRLETHARRRVSEAGCGGMSRRCGGTMAFLYASHGPGRNGACICRGGRNA